MNTLLEGPGRMAFHTDLRLVFRALGDRPRELNWLLTDLQLNVYPPRLPYLTDVRSEERRWLSGNELTETVEQYAIQFIWGVISGFAPDVALDLDRLEPYPYADGNLAFWEPGVRIQHPRADVEIVCFDSTSTLLLSRDDSLSRRFRSFFPEAVDLDEHNRARSARATRQ